MKQELKKFYVELEIFFLEYSRFFFFFLKCISETSKEGSKNEVSILTLESLTRERFETLRKNCQYGIIVAL